MMPFRNNAALFGVFAALCLVVSFMERLLPPLVPVPGIKLGLANSVVLISLYFFGAKQAFGISVIRIFTAAILFSGFSGFVYSFFGGLLSFFVMVLLKKAKIFGIGGVSAAGGVFHNVAQIVAACLITENIYLLYYLPVLTVSGMAAGLLNGFIAYSSLKHLAAVGR